MTSVTEDSTDPVAAVGERVFGSILGGMEMLSIAIGDRLGYYSVLDGHDLTSGEVAAATGCSERYTREWLEQQAVYGLLEVAANDDTADRRRFRLSPGASEVLARPDHISTLAPVARLIAAAGAHWDGVAEGGRTGKGFAWESYGTDMRDAQADANGPVLLHLLPGWLAEGLPELHQRMTGGEVVKVADVGCGAGWASIGLAQAFPGVTSHAFDVDPATIELARTTVADAGVGDRVTVVDQNIAHDPPGETYDLVLAVECVHDMAHPVPVLAAMREMAGADGVVVVVDEKVADEFTAPGDDLEKLMYGFSVLVCLPDGMSGNPTEATGTVLRRPKLESYARQAGFAGVQVLPVETDLWRVYQLS